MLYLFTHYIYRSGQESEMDSWTLFTQSIHPSFLKCLTMLEVQLMKRLLGHELCPKPALRHYTDKRCQNRHPQSSCLLLRDLNLL